MAAQFIGMLGHATLQGQEAGGRWQEAFVPCSTVSHLGNDGATMEPFGDNWAEALCCAAGQSSRLQSPGPRLRDLAELTAYRQWSSKANPSIFYRQPQRHQRSLWKLFSWALEDHK